MDSHPVPWDLRTADGLDAFAAAWHSEVSADPEGQLHTTAWVMVTLHPYKDDEVLERPALVKVDDPTGAHTPVLAAAVREVSGRFRAIAVAVMVGADESWTANDVATEDLMAACRHAPPKQLLIWTEHMVPHLNGRAWSAPLSWEGDAVSIGPLELRACPAMPPDGPLANLLPQRTQLDS